jgi:hypothetical protein
MMLVGGLVLTSLLLWKADRAEQAARKSAASAVTEAEISRVVNDFFLKDVLAQADARGQMRPGTKPDPDLKVRTALDRAADRISGKFVGKPLVEAAIRGTIGESYWGLGLFTQALPHLERAHQLYLGARGPAHVETLDATRMLAQLYYELDMLSEAEQLTLRSLEAARRQLGEQDLEFFKVEHDLSVLYLREEKLVEAERILNKTLEGLRLLLGDRHEMTLAALHSRVQLYRHQKKLDEAERNCLELVKAYRETLGDEHPDTLAAKQDLAAIYSSLKKADLAEKTYIEVLDARKRVLGLKHPLTLDTMNNLATFYFWRDLTKAESLLEQYLALEEEARGKEHSSTLLALNNLGQVYMQRGKLDKAEPLLVRLLESRRRLLDWNRPDTITGMKLAVDNLGCLRVTQRRLKEAEPLIEEALDFRSRNLGENHPETDQARDHLAKLEFALGNHERADSLADEVLKYRRREFGAEDARTIGMLDFLGEWQLQQKKYAEAELSWRESSKVHTKVAPNAWEAFYAKARLGGALLGQKKYAEAERELLEGFRGLKEREATIPENAKGCLPRIVEWLIELYKAMGDTEKAAQWEERRGGTRDQRDPK